MRGHYPSHPVISCLYQQNQVQLVTSTCYSVVSNTLNAIWSKQGKRLIPSIDTYTKIHMKIIELQIDKNTHICHADWICHEEKSRSWSYVWNATPNGGEEVPLKVVLSEWYADIGYIDTRIFLLAPWVTRRKFKQKHWSNTIQRNLPLI